MTGQERVVISVRIIGAVHRVAPKLKMFMVSVLWSDETEVIVYRSFQDFKTFHRQLKKRFPHLNPFRRNDRQIPKFRGKAMRSSLQQRGSKQPLMRMKFLDSYCNKLVMCDQTVTQSSEVTQFFMPKDHDLQPDYTKNSVMILMSDDLPDGSGGGGGAVTHQKAGSVTNPFVTQTYRCVAAYETKDTKNRPFKVALDDKLDVLIKDPAGWWLVENEEKRLAWFPAPFLELWEGEEDDETEFPGDALYCAVRSYSTKKDDEVSVPIGSVVEVLRKSDNGWWLIRFNGKAGYIPSMYLQPYNNPRAGLFKLQRQLHSSTLNLTTSRESQASYPASVTKENNSHSAAPSEGDIFGPGYFQRSQSLDVLSETWTQSTLPVQVERDGSSSVGRARSMSNTSSESSSVSLFTGSESSSSYKEYTKDESSSPDLDFSDRRDSNTSTESSGAVSTKSNDAFSGPPKVPPRPKSEEILTRCTTMTRKAALATKARLQVQPELIHSR
ncbi:NADPH oxidase organizer 1b [Aulostomus maculatus]